MKKLFLFAALFILVSSVFAEPKIPKAFEEEPYIYISNDFTSSYEIYYREFTSAKLKYLLVFNKESLINGERFNLNICFETEKQLNNFIKTIHLSDLENEFIRVRKLLIDNNARARIIETSPYHVIYDIIWK
ncbi:MAG: hypothetical protein J5710_14210 [Treponema sp.]|nr:hypothetical protein [Treponema sp.]